MQRIKILKEKNMIMNTITCQKNTGKNFNNFVKLY